MKPLSRLCTCGTGKQLIIFIVWAQPGSGSPRAQVLADDFGIPVYHVYYQSRWKIVRFLKQVAETIRLLTQVKPELVFIQVGPVVALLPIFFYALLLKKKFIIDSHSGPFTVKKEMIWLPLLKLLARRAECLIVHNEKLAEKLSDWPVRVFVLEDKVPPLINNQPSAASRASHWADTQDFKVTVISSHRPDEPLEEIMQAAQLLPHVRFFITGKIKARQRLLKAPANVTYTDFLPNDEYVSLLLGSDTVMVLTTREYTAQHGAYEAIAAGKPLIISNLDTLKQLYYKGAVYVENAARDIVRGILYAMVHKPCLEQEIRELREELGIQWRRKREWLVKLIVEALDETAHTRL